MAVVSPFAAIRYDARQVGGLEKVLTQPYDKITPEMQQVYWQRSPYNLAYILKGKAGEGDSPTDNVYTRASAYLQKMARARRSSPAQAPGAVRLLAGVSSAWGIQRHYAGSERLHRLGQSGIL